jgi:predicted DNA-binding transcriptional regulator AlpA
MNENGHPLKIEPLWNVKDLCSFLKTSANAVYKLVERKQVPHIRLNRKVLFDPQTIRNWLNQHAVKNA